jgi:hypothetical protein
MTTTKKRINISIGKETENSLLRLARRDQVPPATKAEELLRLALETEEDVLFAELAQARDTKTAKYVDHKAVWG